MGTLVNLYVQSHTKKRYLLAFNPQHFAKVCQALKNKKSPGFGGIMAEHWKYAGKKCIAIIAQIFYNIVKLEYVPNKFKRDVVTSKSKRDKDRMIQDNNRASPWCWPFKKYLKN